MLHAASPRVVVKPDFRRPPTEKTVMTQTRTAGMLVVIALGALSAGGAQAAGTPHRQAPKTARGSSCANPWLATYSKGRVLGDTKQVSLAVSIKGRTIRVTWHAQKGYQFCSLRLVEGQGQIFGSTNPSATYTYTDSTPNHSNAIKTLTASARNPGTPPKKR